MRFTRLVKVLSGVRQTNAQRYRDKVHCMIGKNPGHVLVLGIARKEEREQVFALHRTIRQQVPKMMSGITERQPTKSEQDWFDKAAESMALRHG